MSPLSRRRSVGENAKIELGFWRSSYDHAHGILVFGGFMRTQWCQLSSYVYWTLTTRALYTCRFAIYDRVFTTESLQSKLSMVQWIAWAVVEFLMHTHAHTPNVNSPIFAQDKQVRCSGVQGFRVGVQVIAMDGTYNAMVTITRVVGLNPKLSELLSIASHVEVVGSVIVSVMDAKCSLSVGCRMCCGAA